MTPQERLAEKFDELNIIKAEINISTAEEAADLFEDMLLDAYVEGFAAAEAIIDGSAKLKESEYFAVLDKKYDGESIMQKFLNYFQDGDNESISRLVDSEFHRAYNKGAYDNAVQTAKTKRWSTMGDKKVRETHVYLEGVSTPIDGYFYTFDGDRGRYPGDFEKAENNANCRCTLIYE